MKRSVNSLNSGSTLCFAVADSWKQLLRLRRSASDFWFAFCRFLPFRIHFQRLKQILTEFRSMQRTMESVPVWKTKTHWNIDPLITTSTLYTSARAIESHQKNRTVGYIWFQAPRSNCGHMNWWSLFLLLHSSAVNQLVIRWCTQRLGISWKCDSEVAFTQTPNSGKHEKVKIGVQPPNVRYIYLMRCGFNPFNVCACAVYLALCAMVGAVRSLI